MHEIISLDTGCLRVRVEHSAMPLRELTGFAARNNPKRGFLFLSKVLGKHVPVRPSLMRHTHSLLASGVMESGTLPTPLLVIGMAETATALGHGVFELLAEAGARGLFLNTTRYRIGLPRLTFMESHSHACTHYLHLPREKHLRTELETARTLVLVDDEMSTGNTFVNLVTALRPFMPCLNEIVIVTLLDWLSPDARQQLRLHMPCPVRFASLLQGSFSFTPDPGYHFTAPACSEASGSIRNTLLPLACGRSGVSHRHCYSVEEQAGRLKLSPKEQSGPLLVLGTGEFMYEPYLLARHLEEQGYDVQFQATTRSPILPGDDVRSIFSFKDNYGERIDNFLYNVHPEKYERIFLCYETGELPAEHTLPEQLNGETVYFSLPEVAA